MSFREGLEALLILVLIFKFLEKTDNKHLNRNVVYGFFASVVFSLIIGFVLYMIGAELKKIDDVGKLWESIASLVAVGLATSFIVWMIKHGNKLKQYVEHKTSVSLTNLGIFLISFIFVAREGVEIVIFSIAGQYNYLAILIGLALSIVVALTVYFSLVKAGITLLFQITLLYLIMQAGYLLGYGIHEGLSALKALGYIASDNILLLKVFDLSKSILGHKEGIIGLPLNVLLGWYSKPEWVQFLAQYSFTTIFLLSWYKHNNRKNIQ